MTSRSRRPPNDATDTASPGPHGLGQRCTIVLAGSGTLVALDTSLREVRMETGDVKRQVIETLEDLPSGATVEDAIERLYFLAKVQEGLRQAATGQTVSHEEAKKRLLGD